MTLRSRILTVVAVLFLVINLVGTGYAAAEGETLHAGVHAALVIPGAYLAWRLAQRRKSSSSGYDEDSTIPARTGQLDDRLTHIERSVDAVAIEVERIGEGQRFMTRVFTERGNSAAAATSADSATR